jgi:hypothetical protein
LEQFSATIISTPSTSSANIDSQINETTQDDHEPSETDSDSEIESDFNSEMGSSSESDDELENDQTHFPSNAEHTMTGNVSLQGIITLLLHLYITSHNIIISSLN